MKEIRKELLEKFWHNFNLNYDTSYRLDYIKNNTSYVLPSEFYMLNINDFDHIVRFNVGNLKYYTRLYPTFTITIYVEINNYSYELDTFTIFSYNKYKKINNILGKLQNDFIKKQINEK